MKKAMLVSTLEGVLVANFYDDVEMAIHDADIINVSMGGYAEVYERQVPSADNDYDDSYICVYQG